MVVPMVKVGSRCFWQKSNFTSCALVYNYLLSVTGLRSAKWVSMPILLIKADHDTDVRLWTFVKTNSQEQKASHDVWQQESVNH